MKTLVCVEPGKFSYQVFSDIEWKPGHTLLRIKRIGVCGTDIHAFEGNQPYFNYPRILGHEIAAEIVKTDADGFQEGELVTFIPYFSCGKCVACRKGKPNCCVDIKVCGVHVDGGMAEYYAVPSGLLLHGDGLTADELALVEPFSIGAHAVRRAAVQQQECVLVVGAGPIGLATMEMARVNGAKVIAMDVNKDRLRFCKEVLGLEHVIDPSAEEVPERLKAITNGDMPAVVFDATGNLRAINQAFQFIAHGGRYLLVGLQKEAISFSHPEFHKRESTLMSSRNATRQDFEHVMRSIREKRINPAHYINYRIRFSEVAQGFEHIMNPANAVIKAVIEM